MALSLAQCLMCLFIVSVFLLYPRIRTSRKATHHPKQASIAKEPQQFLSPQVLQAEAGAVSGKRAGRSVLCARDSVQQECFSTVSCSALLASYNNLDVYTPQQLLTTYHNWMLYRCWHAVIHGSIIGNRVKHLQMPESIVPCFG